MKLPCGYSKSHDPRSAKPSFRQIAFDGALSIGGAACMNRRFFSDRAIATASRVADPAIPRPWETGSTDQPIS
jgi:hypothetical protein